MEQITGDIVGNAFNLNVISYIAMSAPFRFVIGVRFIVIQTHSELFRSVRIAAISHDCNDMQLL